MFVENTAYLCHPGFKLLNDTIQVGIIVQSRHSIGSKDIINRYNQKLVNAGFCLGLLYGRTDDVILNWVLRCRNPAPLVDLGLQVLFCNGLATFLDIFLISPRQHMGLNLLDVVWLYHRKPYRRLLAFDYSPVIVSNLEYSGTVAAYVQGYLIGHIEKSVVFDDPFNSFLLLAVLITGRNPRRLAQEQIRKQERQSFVPVQYHFKCRLLVLTEQPYPVFIYLLMLPLKE